VSQTAAERAYFLRHGYAPQADKVLCIDFDGVLYPRDELFASPAPIPGAKAAMQRLRRAGYKLVIFTSRLSPTYLDAQGEDFGEQRAYVEGLLERDGIPFDDVTAEKVPAAVYLDDRALRFDDNWNAVTDFVLFSRES